MMTLGHHWANIWSTCLAGLSLMHVTELLINGILRVWRDGGDCLVIFLPLWCHFHNSRENRFATTKPASFSTQATAMYYVTCSLIEMINMLVWVRTWCVCTHTHIHTSTRSQWSDDSYFYPRAKVSLKVTTAGLTQITVCILYLVA